VIRTSIISSLALSLVLVAGCKKDPPGTEPPTDGDTAQTEDGKKPKKPKKGDKGDTDGGDTDGAATGGDEMDPTKKVCDAVTAEFPEAYFEDTLLIRLPLNVTSDNFVEMSPGFVRLSGEVESVSCIPDMPGGMISYMAMASFPEDAGKDMNTWASETLEAFGYASGVKSEEKVADAKRFYQVVLDVPAGDKPEPAKALFHMVAANGFMYAIVMETHPDAWNALKQTFYATAAGMKFLKPA
jgi:hypothetical protein